MKLHGIRRWSGSGLLCIGLGGLVAQPVYANNSEASGKADVRQLEEVVVTATRNEALASEVPATVTSLSRRQIEQRQPRDEADLFKDDPDVAFARDMRRFGATRVNIRGIEDNRVVQMVDGVRLGDYFNGGGPTNYTMSSALGTPIDFLKRVEVLRGPASSLYGSDALGGVVGYITLDPRDLTGSERNEAYRVRAGYNGASNGKTLSVLAAHRGETVEALLGVTTGRNSEVENKGDVGGYSPARSRPNELDNDDLGLLGKLILHPAAGHVIRLGIEHRKQESEVEILRQSASLSRVSRMWGDDIGKRSRLSVDWEDRNANAWYDRMQSKIYYQKSETSNYNRQQRTGVSSVPFNCSAGTPGPTNCYVEQDFLFEQKQLGGSVQFDKVFKGLAADHLLSYGAELSQQRSETLRDARVWNQTLGTFTKVLAGDATPARDFPTGITKNIGLFVQDETSGLAGGKLSITPGLRYDHRELKPEVDALAAATLVANGKEAVNKTFSAWSPKIAARWQMDEVYSLWGQVVKGFRAPNYQELNGNFRNSTFSYGTAPNPDLKAESSVGIELGLRWAARSQRGQIAVFDNDYKDFIETVRLSCPGDPRCIPTLANTNIAENRSRVNIHGIELRSSWDFAEHWRLDGALARIMGSDETTGEPLNSIEPTRLSLALSYSMPNWGVESRMRAAKAKSNVSDWSSPTNPVADPWFRPSTYAVVDVGGWWQWDKRTRVNLGVNNLFDRKYWLWSDIRQADARNPAGAEFYTQPGRHFVASIQVDF